MTTIPQFTESILQTLDTLETSLPEDSYVVFIGSRFSRLFSLILCRSRGWSRALGFAVESHAPDRRDLSSCLRLSQLSWNQVFFPRKFVLLIRFSPCWVWLNSNETIRNAGSARAAELSAVYPQIIANYSDKYSFQMAYFDFPFAQIIAQWVADGGEAWELIEPVDGFHPNQQANALLGAELWNLLMTNNPDFLGDVNPNNALITKLFGNQGGYDGPTGPPKKKMRIN
jgi:acyloxyacyl hydrolase